MIWAQNIVVLSPIEHEVHSGICDLFIPLLLYIALEHRALFLRLVDQRSLSDALINCCNLFSA
jgi:hypothetical protein